MKPQDRVKEIETQLAGVLRQQLLRIPDIEINSIEGEWRLQSDSHTPPTRPDILANISVQNRVRTLICEVKDPGHPKQIRNALGQLFSFIAANPADKDNVVIPLVASSWLSRESRSLCEEAGVGWFDLAGNCRITFDGIYIERETAERPKAAARNYRSVFSPKAGQVLRTLLRDPTHPWKVADLAAASEVSLGHVSNVRSALLDREWATVDDRGLHLTAPDALLDSWRDNYEPFRGKQSSWYSILHGRQLDEALRHALDRSDTEVHAMLAGLSAAQWLAPYLRGSTTTLYSEKSVIPDLVETLKLKPVKSGANVEIIEPDDTSILRESVTLPNAPRVSSPLLTYLDLSRLDDRSREAADHLREKLLKWH